MAMFFNRVCSKVVLVNDLLANEDGCETSDDDGGDDGAAQEENGNGQEGVRPVTATGNVFIAWLILWLATFARYVIDIARP